MSEKELDAINDLGIQLDNLTKRLKRIEEVFAGPLAAADQRDAAYARQVARDKERANVLGENTLKNRARLAAEAERAKSYPKKQSTEGVLDGR